jgi:hypothetical protein
MPQTETRRGFTIQATAQSKYPRNPMFFFLLTRQQEGALTDDGLAVGLEHGPANHGSAHDD